MAAPIENLRRFYEFGPFRLDPHKHRLMRDGEVVSLPPKAVEALLLMVQHPGKVLERETLIQAVWGSACVEDANLTVAISHLRKALGQHGETADYVATVARVGYRFLPDVREVREEPPPAFADGLGATGPPIGDDGTPSPAVIEEASPSEQAIRRRRALALAALGLVAVVVAGLWAFRGPKPAETTAARPRSIAVLPLKSFARTGEDLELRLRITDALITTLSKVTDVSVRPTHSVLSFAGETVDAREAGRKLDVDAVLDGRVQTEGERLRVTLQLVAVSSGETLWSGQVDGRVDRTLDLQDRITAQLLPQLAHRVTAAPGPTTGSMSAADHFDRAIALEHDMRWTDAEQAFTRAIALDPNNADAHYLRAVVARIVGKTDDYLASMETARRLAPLAKPIARDYFEVVLHKKGCAQGLAYLEAFHATFETSALERRELSAFHDALCARYEHAIATLGRTPLNELSDKTKAFLAVAYAKTGKRQQALNILEHFSRTHARIYLTSYVHVALGDVDAAFAALEKGINEGDGAGRRLKYDELLAPLRSDARFHQLLRRMNLPG